MIVLDYDDPKRSTKEPRPRRPPRGVPADYDDFHPMRLVLALLVLSCVLWAGTAVYEAVQDFRHHYVGEGLRSK